MNIKKYPLAIAHFSVLIITSWLIVTGSLSATAQIASIQNKYEERKNAIDSQVAELGGTLKNLSNNLNSIGYQKKTLKEQIKTMQEEIDSTDRLITETKVTISKIEEQIKANEDKLNELREEMKKIVREIQKQDKSSPLEAIMTSRNLGEVLSNVYGLSVLQVKADEINTQTEQTKAELETNKQKYQQTQKDLQNTQFLLNSKRDGLKTLLDQTEGEEAKYQQLLVTAQQQQKERQSQLEQLEKQFQQDMASAKAAEEERRRQQQAAANQQNNSSPSTSNSNTGGGITGGNRNSGICRFAETRPINVPTGFFVEPTVGYISQNFWCGHDGWDIANGIGTPLVAVANGTIVQKGFHPGGFGNFAVLRIVVPSGQKVYALYAHMSSPIGRSEGSSVRKGETIGQMGNTGWTTGPHLHFMFISDTYEETGLGCNFGGSKCYDPAQFF